MLLDVNSFYRVGGGTRIAGFLLAVATVILLLIGTGPIAFIRTSHPHFDISDGDLKTILFCM